MTHRAPLMLILPLPLAVCSVTAASDTLAPPAGSECATVLTAKEVAVHRARTAAGLYEAPSRDVVFVPLTYHVVRTSAGTGGLPATRICQSLDNLDIAYDPAQIRFYLAGPVDYIDDDFFYYEISSFAELDMLRTTNVVPDTINIYFTEHLPWCGVSSFTTSPVQGIVMNNNCTATATNQSTLAHEVGHYFDLFHTHETAFGVECASGSNCVVAGDRICDTPADPTLGSGNVNTACVYHGTEPPPCSGDPPYAPDVTNLMSYSRKWCRDHFSAGQDVKSIATLLNLRPELVFSSLPAPEDCNNNGVRDDCDITMGTSPDLNHDGIPDDCECPADLTDDGVVDVDDLLLVLGAWGTPDGDVTFDGATDVNDVLKIIGDWGACPLCIGDPDCNNNDICDRLDIDFGASLDCNTNGVPDECDLDAGASTDWNGNGVLDECEFAPPDNDECAFGQPVPIAVTPFMTVSATTDGPAEPSCFDGDGHIYNDVWFHMLAPCDGQLTVSVCDADFDTRLAVSVYEPVCPPPAGTSVACDDDGCSAQSTVTFQAIGGTIYRIRVGGSAPDQVGVGSLDIQIACDP